MEVFDNCEREVGVDNSVYPPNVQPTSYRVGSHQDALASFLLECTQIRLAHTSWQRTVIALFIRNQARVRSMFIKSLSSSINSTWTLDKRPSTDTR